MRQGLVRLRKRLDEINAFDPMQVQKICNDPLIEKLRASISGTLMDVFGNHSGDFDIFKNAADWSTGYTFLNRDPTPFEIAQFFRERQARSRSILESAISAVEERLDNATEGRSPPSSSSEVSNKVFVVHGHDEAAKHELARFLERIELEAIILHEQPNQGRTIVEKFVQCAGEVGFAVVLFTPDDLGGAQAATSQASRARQNVLFELGYFAGYLGRGKVCLLRKGNVEMPSDLYGIIYTELDANEGWKLALVKELKAAGLSFDANRVWG